MSALSYSYKYRALCLWFVSAFKVNVEKALCKTKDLFDYPESLVLSFIKNLWKWEQCKPFF